MQVDLNRDVYLSACFWYTDISYKRFMNYITKADLPDKYGDKCPKGTILQPASNDSYHYSDEMGKFVFHTETVIDEEFCEPIRTLEEDMATIVQTEEIEEPKVTVPEKIDKIEESLVEICEVLAHYMNNSQYGSTLHKHRFKDIKSKHESK